MIGARDAKPPDARYGLLIGVPGGDGSAHFHPFLRWVYKNYLNDRWLIAQAVAPKWDEDQFKQVVWPTAATPLDTITLLRYAESLADVPDKRAVRYSLPLLPDGQTVWVEVEEFDTNRGVMHDFDDGNYFEAIVRDYLAAGHGRTGRVGAATSCLFDARDLTNFSVKWMEREFGRTKPT